MTSLLLAEKQFRDGATLIWLIYGLSEVVAMYWKSTYNIFMTFLLGFMMLYIVINDVYLVIYICQQDYV